MMFQSNISQKFLTFTAQSANKMAANDSQLKLTICDV